MRPPSSRFTGRVCVRCARERKGVFLERRGARVARSLYAQMTRFPAPLRSHSRGEARRAPRVASLSPRRDARDIDEGRVARGSASRATRVPRKKPSPRRGRFFSRGSRPTPKGTGTVHYKKTAGALERSSSPASGTRGSTPPIRALPPRNRRFVDADSSAPSATVRHGSLSRAQAHQHAGGELGGELDVPVVVAAGSKAGRGDAAAAPASKALFASLPNGSPRRTRPSPPASPRRRSRPKARVPEARRPSRRRGPSRAPRGDR